MTDPLAGLGEGASDQSPAATTADIEKIKAELQADFDRRIAGFQSKVVAPRDELISALRSELDELKTSGLSEEERAQLAKDRLSQENQTLRGELELMKLSQTYGDEVPAYQRLLSATTAEEQLQVLRELRSPAQAQQQEEPATVPAAADIPETDPNRPMRTPVDGTLMPDGSYMNDALADRILGSVSVMADVTQRRLRPTD